MKLKNIDFGKLPYPTKLKFSGDSGNLESELILVGILIPNKNCYAGVPIIFCTEDKKIITPMALPTFVEKYGNEDIGLFLKG